MAAGSCSKAFVVIVAPCFNGAATRWPRDRRGTHHPTLGRAGFNGAATRWPRDQVIRLTEARADYASMGPRPDGRGIPSAAASGGNTDSLQWGRDQMAAGSRQGEE